MEERTISMNEMIEFIYKGCGESISKYTIELILELQEEFLTSKGIIQIEEDEIY
ncbi:MULTISPECIES: hypothetical protein [unclassified Romboutsia]|uniref:hypothetical protein n=1 Tax=unclassified Romboutsia TaxID=2626894 RepID=UPI0008210BC2|nr:MULTISPECIES: hypothetical protein [unclassified Romboutsia]SCH34092.1 Uncharacterised protein [uncultured Clostridium sp.]